MAEEIFYAIEEDGFIVKDENTLKNTLDRTNLKTVLYILAKGKREISQTELMAMKDIFSKFRSLKSNLKRFTGTNNPNNAEIEKIGRKLDDINHTFNKYYHYVVLDYNEKVAQKKYNEVSSQIKYLFEKNDNANELGRKEELREQLNRLGLTDEFCQVNSELQIIKSKRKAYEKIIKRNLSVCGVVDYCDVLSQQVDELMAMVEGAPLPSNVKDLIKNWEKRIDDAIRVGIVQVNKRKACLIDRCENYGLAMKPKDTGRYITSMLQLYNPNLKIVYDMFNKIYLSDIENFKFPPYCQYDKENKVLKVDNEGRKENFRIGLQYTKENFIQKLKELNPHANVAVYNNVIYSTEALEKLVLPESFYLEKNSGVITNRGLIPNSNLTFGYQQKKLTKPKEYEVNYDLKDLNYMSEKEVSSPKVQLDKVDELINKLQSLNGVDKVAYIKNTIVTNIVNPEDFILPDNYHFDDDLNIANEENTIKVPVKKTKRDLIELKSLEQKMANSKNNTEFSLGKKKVIKVEKKKHFRSLYRRIVGVCLKLPLSLSYSLYKEEYNHFALKALDTTINLLHLETDMAMESIPQDMKIEILDLQKRLKEKIKNAEEQINDMPEEIEILDDEVELEERRR